MDIPKILKVKIDSTDNCPKTENSTWNVICIKSSKFPQNFNFTQGSGLFVLRKEKFHLQGLFSHEIDNFYVFINIVYYDTRVNFLINYSKSAESFPKQIFWNSTQILKQIHYLYPNDCLYPGEDLVSLNKCFALSFLPDSNLVIYHIKTKALTWHSKTKGKFGVKLCFLENGEFAMINLRSWTVWSVKSDFRVTNTSYEAFLFMGDDSRVWSSIDNEMTDLMGISYKC